MKKLYLSCFALLYLATNSVAQFNQYCGSSRYDKEVFQTVQVTSNVTYGSNTSASGGLTTLTLDVYEPVGDTATIRPLIVWVHGGSFVGGTKNDVDVVSLSEHFAKRGYVCASIEYRLGMSVFPPDAEAAQEAVLRAVQDMKAAVRFFRKDAATTNTYKIDPAVIFGGGSSAGAFTALHLAYMDEPSELPAVLDTNLLGGLEGNSGNPGYSSEINAVVNLCGALGNAYWMHPGDEPVVSMHGTVDNTVPYATDVIIFLGIVPIMQVDGSYTISLHADSIGLTNEMYTFYGADHVPYASDINYMDTTVLFVSNFLYKQFGCTPSDPFPLPNTFSTGIASTDQNNIISVFPNPSNGKINFNVNEKIDFISVYDLNGRVIFEKERTSDDFSLDFSNYPSAVYFYSAKSNGLNKRGKLIISR